jgi:hypothetical protein
MSTMHDRATAGRGDTAQETDAWWGAYSTRTMLPSTLVCLVLTAAIVGGTWTLVEKRYVQWTVWTLAGAVWIVQTSRWWRRVFGINYRLTTRRLLIDKGHWRPWRCDIDLTAITHVEVRLHRFGRWTNVGRIVVHTKSESVPLVLEGIRGPAVVAARMLTVIREAQSTGEAEAPAAEALARHDSAV